MRVDQRFQRGSARKGGPVLRLCYVPDHMFAGYLFFKNILAQMLPCVGLQVRLPHFFPWPGVNASKPCRVSLQGMATVCPVYRENTWSLKRAMCSSRFEMQVPKGLLYWRHISPSQRLVSELRQDVSCPWA